MREGVVVVEYMTRKIFFLFGLGRVEDISLASGDLRLFGLLEFGLFFFSLFRVDLGYQWSKRASSST